MKKWIGCILCLMLVFGCVQTTGKTLSNDKKIQSPINTIAEEEFIPVLFNLTIRVNEDGTYDFQIDDQRLTINNWTGENQSIIVRTTIENPYNNTGSTSAYWRIAEFPAPSWLGWLLFWLTHGDVKPTVNQPDILGVTAMKFNWKAADPETTINDTVIGIEIDPNIAYEIDMWLGHNGNRDWSSIEYTPLIP